MKNKKRIYLGKNRTLYGTTYIYSIENGLEIDENDHHQITRKRVFFDDVLMITRHKYIGALFPVLLIIFGFFFLLIGVSMLEESRGGAIVFFGVAAIFAVTFAQRIIMGVDVITVYGKRSMAQMEFYIRKGLARRIFNDIHMQVETIQNSMASQTGMDAETGVNMDIPLPPQHQDQIAEPDQQI